jgi:hypothetical protein
MTAANVSGPNRTRTQEPAPGGSAQQRLRVRDADVAEPASGLVGDELSEQLVSEPQAFSRRLRDGSTTERRRAHSGRQRCLAAGASQYLRTTEQQVSAVSALDLSDCSSGPGALKDVCVSTSVSQARFGEARELISDEILQALVLSSLIASRMRGLADPRTCSTAATMRCKTRWTPAKPKDPPLRRSGGRCGRPG